MSALGSVHTLNSRGCIRVVDTSALSNIHTLSRHSYRAIIDISEPGNARKLDPSDCPEIMEASCLEQNSHVKHILHSAVWVLIVDVSGLCPLCNSQALDFSRCDKVIDVPDMSNGHTSYLLSCE